MLCPVLFVPEMASQLEECLIVLVLSTFVIAIVMAVSGKMATTFRAVKATDKIITDIKDVANPGDYLLVNEDDHLHGILTPNTADKFLKEGEFTKLYVLRSTYEKMKKRAADLEALFKQANGAKRKLKLAKKPAVAAASKKSDTGKSGEGAKPAVVAPVAADKGKSDVVANDKAGNKPAVEKTSKKPVAAKPTKKARKPKKKCGPDGFEVAEMVAKVMEFVEKHSIKFHQAEKSTEWFNNRHEIKSIYVTIGF